MLWAVARLYYTKTSPGTVAAIYYWVQGFKGIFLISAYFVLISTAVFIIIIHTTRIRRWGGIPDGVVAVAGILNKIERGLVEIGDPLNYQTQAGGKGFPGLAQRSFQLTFEVNQAINMA